MMNSRFHGVIPAMVTPFDSEYRLDEGRVCELIKDYLAVGVHGISVAGSQGEFYMLTKEERLRLLEVSIETVDHRVPVYAGTGSVTTHETIELTKAAESMGADAALLITPYFIQPNDDELYEHYRAVSEATELPLLLYNNPLRMFIIKLFVMLNYIPKCIYIFRLTVGSKTHNFVFVSIVIETQILTDCRVVQTQ